MLDFYSEHLIERKGDEPHLTPKWTGCLSGILPHKRWPVIIIQLIKIKKLMAPFM